MKAVITGAAGQLGRALVAMAPQSARLAPFNSAELDITDDKAVAQVIAREAPDILFNAAAYTAVDRAESEEKAAFAVNGTAVGNLARVAEDAGARLVHISTDFVFDGRLGQPYAPDAVPCPLSAYGRSKLAGEKLAGKNALIVRTAWVYAASGANFVQTMLRLMATRDDVCVVCDQIGTPTYAPFLAEALWALAGRGLSGTYHYTDSGVASWYDFAVAIQEEALAQGVLTREVPVIPIATSDYPTPATRPACAILDKAKTSALLGAAPHWRVGLKEMIKELANHG